MTEAQHEGRGVVLYQAADGKATLDVRLSGNTAWLNQKQMGDLFDKNVRTVSEHIRNVFKEGELEEPSVIRNFRITAADGKTYDTQFRIWATQALENPRQRTIVSNMLNVNRSGHVYSRCWFEERRPI